MKSILLASASVLAFAGAAAAEVEFGGSAEFSYNSVGGVGTFASEAELTIDASQALDNGFTAAASATVDLVAGDFEMDTASLTSDTAGITYFFQADGTEAAYIGDELNKMSVVNEIFQDEDEDDDAATVGIDESLEETAVIEVFGTIAGTTVTVTMNAADELELGVETEVAGATVALGYDDANDSFGILASDLALGALTADIAVASDGTDTFYGINTSTTLGGADLSLDFGDAGWEIGVDYAISDAISVGFTYDDAEAWEVTADYAANGLSLGASFDSDDAWEITAGYEMDALAVDASFDSDDAWTIDGSYDLGNGVDVIAGLGSDDQVYVAATYDLGSGAEIMLSYAEIAGTDDDADEDLLAGTTVLVSFEF